MTPAIPLVAALFTVSHANLDESSMLQMPIVASDLSADQDSSECRCPGYYEEQCLAEAAQGCRWSNDWCQCLGEDIRTPVDGSSVTLPPPGGGAVCCSALTASCEACKEGVSVQEYCAGSPASFINDCPTPVDDTVCCSALTASCEACKEGVSVQEYCAGSPASFINDCPTPVDDTVCCSALTASCEACKEGVSVEEYCAGSPSSFINDCPVIVAPNPADCCFEGAVGRCAGLNVPLAIGDGLTSDYTQVGTVYQIHGDSCFQMVTGCCSDETHVGCVACMHNVLPMDFCDELGDTYPQFCLIGIPPLPNPNDCCHADATQSCVDLGVPHAIGDGITSDYTQVGTVFQVHELACFEMHTACCVDERDMGCVACSNGVLVEDFCSELGEEYPQFCPTVVEPPQPEECCFEAAPQSCFSIGVPHAIGDGITMDYTQVGTVFEVHNGACHETHTACCFDEHELGCVACTNNILPADLCNDHHADFPQFCRSPADCCFANALPSCSDIGVPMAVGDGWTSDYTQVGTEYRINGDACFQLVTGCCPDETQMGCAACMNNVLPENLCDQHSQQYPQFC